MLKLLWVFLVLGGLLMLVLSVGCATIDRSWYQDVYCKQKIARYYTAMPYCTGYAVFEKRNNHDWHVFSEMTDTFRTANEAAKAMAYETPNGVFVGIKKANDDK